jgi:hypothetical protein
MVGLALAVLAAVIAVGIVAGGSGSGQGAGPTGASGPSGAAQRENKPPPRHRSKPAPEPKEVRVPNVLGAQEEAAMAELAEHDLHGHFAGPADSGVALRCSDAAPGATVIGQFPEPGGHAHSGQRVGISPSAYAQTGCGKPTAARACDQSELSLAVGESKPEYTGGGEDLLAIAKVSHVRGDSECAVNSTLTVSVGRSGALMSGIAGNPMTLELHAVLDVGEQMTAGWLLGSWCGSRHDVEATASLEGLQASRLMKDLPYGGGCPTITNYSLYKEHHVSSRR